MAGEERLLSLLRESDGKDRVTVYIEHPKSMKKLPASLAVQADQTLLQALSAVFGEENVKVV